MKPILIPESYNYIGVFLTFGCNLNCSYCINHFEQRVKGRKMASAKQWLVHLNRINSRPDLPVTLQGGEPSLHPDFIEIINNIKPELNIDILTNLQFDLERFIQRVRPERLNRDAPYASIRVSYHPETMDLEDTIQRTLKMSEAGFSIGIWSVLHPVYDEQIKVSQKKCQDLGIDFRTKEFLGEYNNKLYGRYRYPGVCDKKFTKKVYCKSTELLLDPKGDVFRCHRDIYKEEGSIGSLFNPDFQIKDIYRPCSYFGYCNPCDVKVKTNRFQQFGHTSVDIQFL